MFSKPFDYAIFIGKFSPIHDGHVAVIRQALTNAEKVIVVLGQCFEARNTRLPFTEDERNDMVMIATNHDPRVIVTRSENYLYNDTRWIASVQDAVFDAIRSDGGSTNSKIGLAGMSKDATSYYLKIFPQWRHGIDCEPHIVQYKGHDEILSSSLIRNKVFGGETGYLRPYMDEKVISFMDDFVRDSDDYPRLLSDWKYEQVYESAYGKGPHVTVDACVIQSGHILLINRGREYGKGLFAMPGGFLNKIVDGVPVREKLVDGMLRELVEETGLKTPAKVLRGSIEKSKTYDDPYRSNRSHIITTAFHIVLEGQDNGLPKVKGMDDAMKADWYPLADMMERKDEFFEDHWHIISDLTGF